MKKTLVGRLVPALLGAAVGLVSLSNSASAATYYVSSSGGNDTYTGLSPSEAWQSVGKVSGVTFAPGDIIAFKRGDTWSGTTLELNGSGTSASVIRLTAYDASGVIGDSGSGALPALSGSALQYVLQLINQQHWTIEDFDVSGGQRAAVSIEVYGEPANTVMAGITLRKLNVHNTSYNDTTESWYGDGINIYNDGANQQKFDGLVIDSCTVTYCYDRAITVDSTQSLSVHATSDASYYNTGLQITNDSLSYTREDGMYLSGCIDFLVQNNTIAYAGGWEGTFDESTLGNFNSFFWCSCIGVTNGCRVQYNTVHHTAERWNTASAGFFTDNMAFDLDLGNAGLHIVQYNFTHDNAGGFMETLNHSLDDTLSGITDQCLVRFNISYDDNLNENPSDLTYCMLIIPEGRHQEFYYNTFYCGGNGYAIVNRRWDGSNPLETGLFQDNVFYSPGGFYNVNGVTGNFTYTDNCIYGTASGATGATGTIDANPLFRNSTSPTSATDLQLLNGSPCVNAGSNSGLTNPNPQEDYFGYAYDLGTTLGADQYENVMKFSFEQNVSDTSGHGNNGTLEGSGSSYVTSAKDGSYSLSLNGSGYVQISPSTSTDLISSELGVDLWVYPTTSSGYRRLIDKMTVGGTDGFFLDLSPTNQVRFNVRGYQVLTSTTLTTSTWTHIEALFTESGAVEVYINGTLAGSTTAGAVPAINNTHDFLIGEDQNGGSRFVGYLDDIQIRRDSTLR